MTVDPTTSKGMARIEVHRRMVTPSVASVCEITRRHAVAATTQCGDSGGPVFAVNADGSVTAVGITSAGTMGVGTVAPPCGTPYSFALAQLIQPMLRASATTVLTS